MAVCNKSNLQFFNEYYQFQCETDNDTKNNIIICVCQPEKIENAINLGGMIFNLLKEKKSLHSVCDSIYESLPFMSQLRLKKIIPKTI